MHCFDDVRAILFIVNLAGYDQVLFEDTAKNRMLEELELFEQVSFLGRAWRGTRGAPGASGTTRKTSREMTVKIACQQARLRSRGDGLLAFATIACACAGGRQSDGAARAETGTSVS